MKDSLGDRMKGQYENRTRFMLPRRTYTIIRVDGKAFHTFTRGLPCFDVHLARSMDWAAKALCQELQGAELAYMQSDEISVLLTDFNDINTEAWFDGNLQKQCSVAASIATAEFNSYYNLPPEEPQRGSAYFDARVFTIADPTEVANYFLWRQRDAERNSLSMLCQQHYSHKELQGQAKANRHDLLHAKGVNWNDLSAYWKRGRCWVYDPLGGWLLDDNIPVFSQQWDYLRDRILTYNSTKGDSDGSNSQRDASVRDDAGSSLGREGNGRTEQGEPEPGA